MGLAACSARGPQHYAQRDHHGGRRAASAASHWQHFSSHNLTKPWKRWPLGGLDSAGLKQALLYFSATVALKGITTADRYMMQHTSSAEVVGAYVAYIGIAMTLIILLDARYSPNSTLN